uniref:Uncharacterized protein n=1 Tax=Anopheles albimanus TaxID=7167 RepID=A0A182FKN4_ANOAL
MLALAPARSAKSEAILRIGGVAWDEFKMGQIVAVRLSARASTIRSFRSLFINRLSGSLDALNG